MGLSQCLSDREFPEFYKTILTFDPIGFLRGVMGHYMSFKKRQGLPSEAVCDASFFQSAPLFSTDLVLPRPGWASAVVTHLYGLDGGALLPVHLVHPVGPEQ